MCACLCDRAGKVVIEASNPIRDKGCVAIGCDGKQSKKWWVWNAGRDKACAFMGCDDVGMEALLVGSADIDLSGGTSIDATVTINPTIAAAGATNATQDASLSIATSVQGLDDSVSWAISSSFLSRVAQDRHLS